MNKCHELKQISNECIEINTDDLFVMSYGLLMFLCLYNNRKLDQQCTFLCYQWHIQLATILPSSDNTHSSLVIFGDMNDNVILNQNN